MEITIAAIEIERIFGSVYGWGDCAVFKSIGFGCWIRWQKRETVSSYPIVGAISAKCFP